MNNRRARRAQWAMFKKMDQPTFPVSRDEKRKIPFAATPFSIATQKPFHEQAIDVVIHVDQD